MLTAYSRVTVVTSDRTVDLALPNALPLAEVLPQLMHFAAPQTHDSGPAAWSLARVGGATLPLSQTLAESGVLDGEVLELRVVADDVRPAIVEDVRDAVEDSVDASGGTWITRTTATFSLLTAAAVLGALGLAELAVGLGVPDAGRGTWLDRADTAAAAAVVVLVLLGTSWWGEGRTREVDVQAVVAAAMVWGAVLASDLAAAAGVDGFRRVAVAAVGLALVGGAARALTPAATGHAAYGAVVVAAEVAVAATDLLGLPTGQAVRVVPVLAVLAVGVLPRVSLSVGGLASADYRVRHVGRLELSVLRARYRTSNALLVGSLAGIATVVAQLGWTLELDGRPWDRTLALSLAAAAVLRSRLFSRTQHMVPLRVAGLLVAALVLVRVAIAEPALLPYVALVPAAALLVGIGLVSVPMSDITRARVKRTLNVVEFLVVVDLLVVLVGAMGVYGRMGGLVT